MGEYIKTLVFTKNKSYQEISYVLNEDKWTMGDSALLFTLENRKHNTFKTTVKEATKLLKDRHKLLDLNTNIGKSIDILIEKYLKKISFFNEDCIIESDCSVLYCSDIGCRDVIQQVKSYEIMFEKIKKGYTGKELKCKTQFEEMREQIEQYLINNIILIDDVLIDNQVSSYNIKSLYNLDYIYDGFYSIYPIYIKCSCNLENMFAYLHQYPNLFPLLREFDAWEIKEKEKVISTFLVLGNLRDENVFKNNIPKFYL